jgi:hypothetical protein
MYFLRALRELRGEIHLGLNNHEEHEGLHQIPFVAEFMHLTLLRVALTACSYKVGFNGPCSVRIAIKIVLFLYCLSAYYKIGCFRL